MGYGVWCVVYGGMGYGVWCVVYGGMGYGDTVYGGMVYGVWCMVVWCMVYGGMGYGIWCMLMFKVLTVHVYMCMLMFTCVQMSLCFTGCLYDYIISRPMLSISYIKHCSAQKERYRKKIEKDIHIPVMYTV